MSIRTGKGREKKKKASKIVYLPAFFFGDVNHEAPTLELMAILAKGC